MKPVVQDAIIFEEPDTDGVGITKAHLVNAVSVWFALNGDGTRTVGEAAAIFRVSPEFLASCIDDLHSPFFFLSPREDGEADADRLLDCDGY